MAKEIIEKSLLRKLDHLKTFKLRKGKYYAPYAGYIGVVGTYFDTSKIGIEVWYLAYHKWGFENQTCFYESIENPDRNVVIQTASEMGEKRNYREIVEKFYSQNTQPSQHTYRTHIPSWHPVKTGPIGIAISSNDGFRLIGFNHKETKEGRRWENDEFGLVNKLKGLYFDARRK